MTTRAITCVLALAIGGTYGCVPAVSRIDRVPQKLGERPHVPAIDAVVASVPPPAPEVATVIEPAVERETVLIEAASDTPVTMHHEVTGETVEPVVPAAPPKPKETSSVAAPKPQGPSADDQLLNLLEKDLLKAVEQPPERRRLRFSKAVIEHPRVRYFLREFSKNQKEYFAKALARSGKFFPMIARVLRDEGLPEELAYLALIESNFHPRALSVSGAVGLWQFVPETARRYGLKMDAWVDERRDPVKSTHAAAAYLKDLHNYFGRWYLTMAAYNAGEGAIDRALRASGATDFWSLSDKAKLRDETRNFVPRFVAASLIASEPKKYGFDDLSYEEPLEYEEVQVGGNMDLATLAQLANTDLQTMQELNIELIRGRTPPVASDFRVKIPAGHAPIFLAAYEQRGETEPVEVVTHEVQKGDTLFSIARRYGQEVRAVMELNGLTSYRLQIGQKLKVIFDRLQLR